MTNDYQLQTILAIDTSCDETSAAATLGERVLSNVVASQVGIHRKYGGVEPLRAKRAHQQLLGPVIEEALGQAETYADRYHLGGATQLVDFEGGDTSEMRKLSVKDFDAIAVTIGPGLAIALEVGVAKAKELAKNYQKPLLAVDHMEGHLLSPFARNAEGNFGLPEADYPPLAGPALGLLVSGGHTELVLMKDFGKYRLVGQTLDDAAGECFDKVARILGLGYPGGPIISKLAQKGDPNAFDFSVPMRDSGDFNFSFSGLKTACLYANQKSKIKNQKYKENFAASFERVVIAHLADKLVLACREFKPKMVLLGGGVIANQRLQERIKQETGRLGIPVYLSCETKLLTDNAAMIGVAAFYKAKRGDFVKDVDRLERVPNLSLG